MSVTAKAKSGFRSDEEDLLRRGRKLISESIEHGVTSMRAHVEVDTIVGLSGIDAALQLKEEFKSVCDIQIAGKLNLIVARPSISRSTAPAFAQERLFSSVDDSEPGENYHLLLEAIDRDGVEVIGSAPYVEASIAHAKTNLVLILEAASSRSLHVDFHLDYNLDATSEPLIYELIARVKEAGHNRPGRHPKRRITIGHATRLQLFTVEQWRDLMERIGDLPITFIALPNSDMYMQGREATNTPLGAPRSTLRVPYLAREYGLEVAMSVNNVGNAFTPQGSLDPLALCPFGVAIFQAATPKDLETLLRSVTITSKVALGMEDVSPDLYPQVGDQADFVILHGNETLTQAALNPSYDRTTIKAGVIVAQRQTERFIYGRPSRVF
ncbi:hypothetical protein V5O48_003370 [Marasmius crinis-equi]|uniref:Cytosine deaminase n=1 Tax=Marasmius crinis-equi TaxID=585013 RepID=A0ABR3FT34_9AGAR